MTTKNLTGRVIKVTEADIKKGKRSSCHYCPVALAVKRSLKKTGRQVDVDGCTIDVRKEAYFLTPTFVAKRIDKFDDIGVMVPFQFKLGKQYNLGN